MTPRRYRCRFCGLLLPAWPPVAQVPNGAMLLQPLSQHHRDQIGAYLTRMHRTEDIATATKAYEVIEREDDRI